jgi:hypothetical protein
MRKRFSSLLGRSAALSLHDPQLQVDPAVIQARLNRTMRRRLSDDLVALTERACQMGHHDTAEELLGVLRNLLQRELETHPARQETLDAFERVSRFVQQARDTFPSALSRDAA